MTVSPANADPAYALATGTWAAEPLRTISTRVACTKAAPRLARMLADEGFRGAIPNGVARDLRMLLTEVVTNALVHGAVEEPIAIRMALSRTAVRVEVEDAGPGFHATHPPVPHASGEGGFGLVFVDRLSSAWGTSDRGPTCVWFELATTR